MPSALLPPAPRGSPSQLGAVRPARPRRWIVITLVPAAVLTARAERGMASPTTASTHWGSSARTIGDSNFATMQDHSYAVPLDNFQK